MYLCILCIFLPMYIWFIFHMYRPTNWDCSLVKYRRMESVRCCMLQPGLSKSPQSNNLLLWKLTQWYVIYFFIILSKIIIMMLVWYFCHVNMRFYKSTIKCLKFLVSWLVFLFHSLCLIVLYSNRLWMYCQTQKSLTYEAQYQ